jgi:anti-sigma-K factor RskA
LYNKLNVNEIISSGILELYVLGKTNAQENTQVETWQANHPEVAAELLAIENNLELFDLANAVQPTANAKQNLFAKMQQGNEFVKNTNIVEKQNTFAETPVVKFNFWKYAAAAAIALLIGSSIFTYNKVQDINIKLAKAESEVQDINSKLAKAESEIANQKQEIASLSEGIEGAASATSQQVVLKGTPTSPSSTAKIFWVRNTGDVYVEASGLPDAPTGTQYQLWAIIDNKPVDAGMIISDSKGKKYNIQKMKSFGKAQAFAITLEKEGGSPTPTMEKMVVMSTI